MIPSSKVVRVGTIPVIGAIAGLTSQQKAVTEELNDTACAYVAHPSSGDDNSSGNGDLICGSNVRGEWACNGC